MRAIFFGIIGIEIFLGSIRIGKTHIIKMHEDPPVGKKTQGPNHVCRHYNRLWTAEEAFMQRISIISRRAS